MKSTFKIKSPYLIEVIIIQFFMHTIAIYGLVKYGITQNGIIAFFIGYILTMGFGIVVGYHRLLSHVSYSTSLFFKRLLALLGTLAFQGGPIMWASIHRSHHKSTDNYGDAHSAAKGFFWSHMGWTFSKNPNGFSLRESRKYVQDLLDDPFMLFLDKYALFINIIIFVCGYLFLQKDIFYWLFPIRIITVWHLTWCVNSFSHSVYPFANSKVIKFAHPKNTLWIALLCWGEGWHYNHHQNPSRASFSKKLWQVDFAYLIIKILSVLGLAKINRTYHQTINQLKISS